MRRGTNVFVIGRFLALGLAFACEDKPPIGQIVLHVDTDAIVAEPVGAPVDDTRLSPLVDRARFEVLVDGQATPGSTRDFVVDAAMLRERRLSFGIVPVPGATDVAVRVTLFRADRVLDDIEPGIAMRTTVTLPVVGSEGVIDASVVLHADDFGAEIGPVPATPGAGGPSLANTWHGGRRASCAGATRPGEACVSGGSFFFGNPQFRGRTPANDIYEERLVSISPFFLDVAEVTVADFRNALASLGTPALPDTTAFCTWTPTAGANERRPLNCVGFVTARAYCQAIGKDLPTEAQVEFVSSGLGDEWAFPWGNDEPDCEAAVWGRAGKDPFAQDPQNCRAPDDSGGVAFPGSGTSDTLASNVLRNAGGDPIVDLGGNLSEWVRDTWARPTDAYWSSVRPMKDPVNETPSAADGPQHTVRGGNWALSALTTRAGFRERHENNQVDALTGFRCARPDTGN